MLVTLEGYSMKKFKKSFRAPKRDIAKVKKAVEAVKKSAYTKAAKDALVDYVKNKYLPAEKKETAPAVPSAVQALPVAEKIEYIEDVIVSADFLTPEDKENYLRKLEEIKKAAGGIVPEKIKVSFSSGETKADYLYNLEKALAGISGELNLGFSYKSAKKKVKSVKKKVKKIKKAAKPYTPIAAKIAAKTYKITKNPVAIAAVSAIPVVGPAAAGGMVAYTAAYKGYQETKALTAEVEKAKETIQDSEKLKRAILESAAADTGIEIPPEGLTDEKIKELPPEKKEELAENIKERQAQTVSLIVAEKVEKKLEEQQAEPEPEPETWTPEQIDAFNKSQERGGIEAVQESYAATLAQQGKLLGEELLEFWKVDPYKAELKQAALLIFGSPRYPGIVYPSAEYVEKILSIYLSAVLKMSIAAGKNMYYEGTTGSEQKQALGNIYIKAVYMLLKGLTNETEISEHFKNKEFDYNTRDLIWIILAQLKTLADSAVYKKYLQPFDFLSKAGSKEKTEIKEKASGNTGLMIGAAAILALMIFKKGK